MLHLGGRRQGRTEGCDLQGVVGVWFFFYNWTTECIIVLSYSCSSKPFITCCKIFEVSWSGPYPSTFCRVCKAYADCGLLCFIYQIHSRYLCLRLTKKLWMYSSRTAGAQWLMNYSVLTTTKDNLRTVFIEHLSHHFRTLHELELALPQLTAQVMESVMLLLLTCHWLITRHMNDL